MGKHMQFQRPNLTIASAALHAAVPRGGGTDACRGDALRGLTPAPVSDAHATRSHDVRRTGAHRPALGAESAGEPGPRGARARLPRLLPALALLLCGLHLLAAAPASAQVPPAPTVPRNVQATPGDARITLTWQAPSTWGTWPAREFGVEWKKSSESLWGGVYRRRVLATIQSTETSFAFTDEQRTHLGQRHIVANGTAYDLRIYALSQQPGTDGSLSSHYRSSGYVTLSNIVPGVAQTISSVTVRPGLGRLDLSWAAPASSVSAITGYDVHYTSAASGTVPDGAAASGSDPAAAWVAVSRSGTTATQTLPNLPAGTYRVRVRAVNTHGNAAWAFATGVPQTPTTGAVWSATLVVQDIGGGQRGCWNDRNTVAQKCSTSTALSDDDFSVGGTDFSITQIRHNNLSDGGTLQLRLNKTGNAALAALKLCVGTDEFALTGLATAGNTFWLNTGYTWSTGDTLELSIGPSCPQGEPPKGPKLDSLTLKVGEHEVPLDPAFGTVSRNADGAALIRTVVVPYDTTHLTVVPTWSDTRITATVSSRHNASGAKAYGTPPTRVESGGSVDVLLHPGKLPEHRTRVSILLRRPTQRYGAGGFVFDVVRGLPEGFPRWSATLTVKELDGGVLGCSGTGATGCDTLLPNRAFMVDRTEYSIERVYTTTGGTRVNFGAVPNDALRAMKFCVGATGYPIATAAEQTFATGDLRWTAGETVGLSIGESCDASFPPVGYGYIEANISISPERVTEVDYSKATGAVGSAARRTSASELQAASRATIIVTLSQPAPRDLLIPVTATSPSATGGTGWYILNRWIGIRRGQTESAPAAPHDKPHGYKGTTFIMATEDDDSENEMVNVSLGALPEGLTAGATTSATLTIIDAQGPDNDPNANGQGPGVEVSAEALDVAVGADATYTVKLQSPPIDDVFIDPAVADAGKASVSPSRLHFTADNWNVAQEVTVRGLSAGATAVRHSVQTTDPLYGGTAPPDVAVTVGASSQGTDGDGRLANPHAALIAKVREWRDDPRWNWNKAHTDRWDRVLLALGETVPDSSLTPMGAAEAQTYADRGWTRWVEVAEALRQIENGGTQTPPPAQTPVPAVSIAAGAAVTEGAPAGFTLTASPAPAADLGVSVTVAQDGAFAQASALGARTVTIPAGQASASFSVATVDDAADEPDGAVTAALGSGSGYTLGDAASARVAVADDDEALPAILTKRTVAREGRDDAAVFTVRLDRPAARTVYVDYATADGAGRWAGTMPARAGADYTATSGRLAFAPGEHFKFVRVPVLDDAIDEGMEHFLLRFSNPRGATLAAGHRETQGLIWNDDHLQAMWLSRFGRTVAGQVTDAISDRLGSGLAPGAHATLAGQNVDLSQADDGKALTDVLTGLAQRFGARAPAANPQSFGDDPFARRGPSGATTASAPTGRDLLLGSAFHVAPEREGSGPGLAAWGRVAHGSFDGEHADDTGRTSVDGKVVTGVLGADADFGRLLAGVAVSLSEGDGKFNSPGADVGSKGGIESTMTTVSPYARFRATDRISVWGLAGWGTGDMTIKFDDGAMAPVRTDLSMQLGAVGARGELLTQGPEGGMDLALKADAFFVRTESEKAANSVKTEADASRIRLVLEGGRTFAVGEGASVRPSLELGVRHDGGDAETGTGVELGGGVAYSDAASGLSVEAKARMLVAHADSDYREWGASATARLDPGERGRGLSFSLSPTIGAASSTTQRLWGAHDARGLAPGPGAGSRFEAARGLTAEAGYGMALFGDRFTGTPNVGFGMSDGGARDYRIGWRLTSAVRGDPGFEVNLDATRRESAGRAAPPEHAVMLRSLIRW